MRIAVIVDAAATATARSSPSIFLLLLLLLVGLVSSAFLLLPPPPRIALAVNDVVPAAQGDGMVPAQIAGAAGEVLVAGRTFRVIGRRGPDITNGTVQGAVQLRERHPIDVLAFDPGMVVPQ